MEERAPTMRCSRMSSIQPRVESIPLTSRSVAETAPHAEPQLIDRVVALATQAPQLFPTGRATAPVGKRVVNVRQRTIKNVIGAGFGAFVGGLTGGGIAAFHEFVGHLRLGAPLVYNYPHGLPHDFNVTDPIVGGGISNWATGANGTNAFGTRIGTDQADAWISFAGTVSTYALTLAFTGFAGLIAKKHSVLGPALLGASAIWYTHDGISYPAPVGAMSSAQIHVADPANDFVAAALDLSRVYQRSPHEIAAAVAAVAGLVWPIAATAAIATAATNSRRDIVSDSAALTTWMQDPAHRTELKAHLDEQNTEDLTATVNNDESMSPAKRRSLFIDLTNGIEGVADRGELANIKDRLLNDWDPHMAHRPQDNACLTAVAVGLLAFAPLLRVVGLITNEHVRGFSTFVDVTLPLIPAYNAGTALRGVYEVSKSSVATPGIRAASAAKAAAQLAALGLAMYSASALLGLDAVDSCFDPFGKWYVPATLMAMATATVLGCVEMRSTRAKFTRDYQARADMPSPS